MNSDKQILNLTFHGLGEPPGPISDDERKVWVQPEAFAEILDLVRGNESIAITFDDGNASDIEIGLPLLVRRGMKAIFFVCAGRLGQSGFISTRGLRELIDAGMQIGSHGLAHRSWKGLDANGLRDEIYRAKVLIEQETAQPVTVGACPFGCYDRRSLGALKSLGFTRVYTSDRGWTRRDAWLQARNTIRRCDGAANFKELLCVDSSFQRLVRDSKMTLKRWL